MQKMANVQNFKQEEKGQDLLKQLETGEMNLLTKMIKAPTYAAGRARLIRGYADAIKAAEEIIANRKDLIKNFSSDV